jgi:hypothetical protein
VTFPAPGDDACSLGLQLSPHGLVWGYRQRHDCGVGSDLIVVSVDPDMATPVGRDRGQHRFTRDLPVKGPIETRESAGSGGKREQGPTDFMCLAERLQRDLTSLDVLWLPPDPPVYVHSSRQPRTPSAHRRHPWCRRIGAGRAHYLVG